MDAIEQDKKLIGRAERVDFPELNSNGVHARIDTGARTSSMWVSQVEERDGQLHVVFYGEGCPHYTGKVYTFDEFEHRVVASSNGQTEQRYAVKLLIVLGGRRIRSSFTLADRSTQVYPVLVGRNTLRGKFIVDVKRGEILTDAERQRTSELRAQLRAKERGEE